MQLIQIVRFNSTKNPEKFSQGFYFLKKDLMNYKAEIPFEDNTNSFPDFLK